MYVCMYTQLYKCVWVCTHTTFMYTEKNKGQVKVCINSVRILLGCVHCKTKAVLLEKQTSVDLNEKKCKDENYGVSLYKRKRSENMASNNVATIAGRCKKAAQFANG